MAEKDYKGKVAVITGGGGGIAHGYALPCLKNGMKLVLGDINEERLASQKTRLEGEVLGAEIATFKLDCSQEDENAAFAKFAQDTFGSIDIVYLNAGIHFHKDFSLMTKNDWDLILRCNLFSVIVGMRVFLPVLEKNSDGGNMIVTGSGASVSFVATMAHYCTCKHAVLGLCGSVQQEINARGANILITCVMPDFVSSNLLESEPDVRAALGLTNEVNEQTDQDKAMEKFFSEHVDDVYHGAPAPDASTRTNEQAGEVVWQAVQDKKNFIFTHEGIFSTGAAMAEQVDSGYLVPWNE